MGRTTKTYERLDALEAAFREQLIAQLTTCAAGRNDLLFFASRFRPPHYPKSLSTEVADELVAQADAIRALCVKLRSPFSDTLASRFLECVRRWADHADHHRGSARTIAVGLLAEIQSPSTPAED